MAVLAAVELMVLLVQAAQARLGKETMAAMAAAHLKVVVAVGDQARLAQTEVLELVETVALEHQAL
jgi:hypothetical protein